MKLIASVALAIGLVFAGEASATEELDRLFADYWANELEENPFAATGVGVDAYNDRVPGATAEDHARRLDEAKGFLARLEAADLDGASRDDRLNAALLGFILRHDIELAAFDGWRIPFLSDYGFHQSLGFTIDSTPFRNEEDYRRYLTRLERYPAYLDQNIANMRKGLADGFTQPKEILDGILPSFDAQVSETAQSHPLYAPFIKMPASISGKRAKALQAEGAAVLNDKVIPAFRRVADFMRNEYAPNAADKIGAGNLPNGAAYYEALVHYYTTRDDVTADEIHKIGLKEVARIRKEMDGVIKKTGFKGDFAAFLEFLRTDPQFYAGSAEELLERAAYLAKTIDGKLPGYFNKLPRQPYSVEAVPDEIAPNYTTARYVSAPPHGKRGGRYWVNTYALDKRPLYELPALTLHEAVPGHHLQNALAYEVENAPDFRTQFYPHAFGEGWGLYSEKLGIEMGMYKTPYEDFGRLSMEMWRACRLVIDTGMHSKGWTRRQALDYLAGNTALSLKNVQVEVDRYIAWPGQALAYKMGELTIVELRRKAEKALGDKFDIREFHDVVVAQGGLPLEILTDEVDAYIERKLSE
ncbi:MAG: DUF885 domain-containing protein [Parvularculaceae bacterium]|nr:DUF885 domain-containing protein [Parvularculaceae bacterium]